MGKIYYVAPDGKAKETRETLKKPATLERRKTAYSV
jgi:hypothetical protein